MNQEKSDFSLRFWTVVIMILVAAALRILPHLPNFSPVTAMALFGGAYISRKWMAVLFPLFAMFLGDLVLGFHSQMPIVYLSFALVTVLGFMLRGRAGVLRITGIALSGSLLFFVLTNFGVWAEGILYPRTADGLFACFIAAIPFLQNSLMGDLIFTGALFGGLRLLEMAIPQVRAAH